MQNRLETIDLTVNNITNKFTIFEAEKNERIERSNTYKIMKGTIVILFHSTEIELIWYCIAHKNSIFIINSLVIVVTLKMIVPSSIRCCLLNDDNDDDGGDGV